MRLVRLVSWLVGWLVGCRLLPARRFQSSGFSVHARPFVEVSQKSICKRPGHFLAINAHKMAPRTTQWLQERPWNAPTKGLLRLVFRVEAQRRASVTGSPCLISSARPSSRLSRVARVSGDTTPCRMTGVTLQRSRPLHGVVECAALSAQHTQPRGTQPPPYRSPAERENRLRAFGGPRDRPRERTGYEPLEVLVVAPALHHL